jgi:hypothetical protein
MKLEEKSRRARPHVWPGMPTRESQMFEIFVGFFPGWTAILAILVALLLPLVQSCGN